VRRTGLTHKRGDSSLSGGGTKGCQSFGLSLQKSEYRGGDTQYHRSRNGGQKGMLRRRGQ